MLTSQDISYIKGMMRRFANCCCEKSGASGAIEVPTVEDYPVSPEEGQIVFINDIGSGQKGITFWDGTAWKMPIPIGMSGQIEVTRFGSGVPTVLPEDSEGDNYMNVDNGDIYQFESGAWILKIYGEVSGITDTWDNTTRPSTPYPGQDGYNTDSNTREYWNTANWIQY